MKPADIDNLLQILVADGEVSRCALKVLTTWPGSDRFERFFRIEVEALLAQVDQSSPKERRLGDLMRAARDRILGLSPAAVGVLAH